MEEPGGSRAFSLTDLRLSEVSRIPCGETKGRSPLGMTIRKAKQRPCCLVACGILSHLGADEIATRLFVRVQRERGSRLFDCPTSALRAADGHPIRGGAKKGLAECFRQPE